MMDYTEEYDYVRALDSIELTRGVAVVKAVGASCKTLREVRIWQKQIHNRPPLQCA